MASLHLEDIREGMSVANDIRNQEGYLLLKQGQQIEERHIRLLKIWGIYHLEVVMEADDKNDEQRKEIPQHVLEYLGFLFSCNDIHHPAIQTLFQLRLGKEEKGGWKKWKEERLEVVSPPSASCIDALKWEQEAFPEVPSILGNLNNVLADNKSSSRDIADAIEISPSLTIKLLRLANSPFYGFYSKIETISRAVTVIGTKEIGEIAIGLSIFEYFKGIDIKEINVKNFFRHCLWCGIISRILAINNGMKNTERFFVYGLVHKIGRLLVFSNFPEIARYLIYETYNSKDLLTNIEKKIRVNHTRVAGELAKKWALSSQLVDSITHYLNPVLAKNPLDASIIHLADVITHAMGIGDSGDKKVPSLSLHAWSVLKIDPAILPVAIRQTEHQVRPLFEMFFDKD